MREVNHVRKQLAAPANASGKLFAVIAFARRPLRISGSREAIGILSTEDPRGLKSRTIPRQEAVERLFAPLIETPQDPDDPKDCFCHLFHRTVRDFFLGNATLFRRDRPSPAAYPITASATANACLLYLSQDRCSRLMREDKGQWVTATGENADDRRFLTYWGRYWDKNLETSIKGSKPSSLRPTSKPQSRVPTLYVEHHFETYVRPGCSRTHE